MDQYHNGAKDCDVEHPKPLRLQVVIPQSARLTSYAMMNVAICALMMEAVSTSETLASFYQTT
jgi:hypothetical protein